MDDESLQDFENLPQSTPSSKLMTKKIWLIIATLGFFGTSVVMLLIFFIWQKRLQVVKMINVFK